MARPIVVALALALAGSAAACFPASTYECDGDAECSGGEVCARTHTCELEADIRAARVRWDIDGVAASTECAARGLGDLTIGFIDSAGSELAYSPVPCPGGLYSIDKLPTTYDRVELYGYADGILYYAASYLGADPEVSVSLR